jgi:hypothetical protein
LRASLPLHPAAVDQHLLQERLSVSELTVS